MASFPLTRYAGGGEIYTPAMMDFDGVSYYGSTSNITLPVATEIEFFLRLKIQPFTGDTTQILHGFYIPSIWWCAISVYSSDYSTNPEYANKILVSVGDTSNVSIFRVLSKEIVADGNRHSVYAGFDADTGVGEYIIDGVDADDLTYASRAMTPGTLNSGLHTHYVGRHWSASDYFFIGQMGPYGFNMSKGSWRDHMNDDGSLKEYDYSSWLVGSSHGQLSVNEGTAGNYAVNGTIELSDAGSTNHPHLGLNTVGDATAADIADGKVAWVNGVEIVGIAPQSTARYISHTYKFSLTSSIVIDKPSNVIEDNLLVIVVASRNAIAGMPEGSGWTEVLDAAVLVSSIEDPRSAGNEHLTAWYKKAGSSEPSTYTLALAGTGTYGAHVYCLSFQGGTSVLSHSTAPSKDGAALTMAETDVLVSFHGTCYNPTFTEENVEAPTDMLLLQKEYDAGTDTGGCIAIEHTVTDGSTGITSWTSEWSATSYTYTLNLQIR